MSAVPDSLGLRFRAMGYADLAEVMAIETRAYRFSWTEEVMRDCIRVGYHCRLLELDGRIEGYGILSVAAGEAHVLNLCIAPRVQGRGLAVRLLHHLLELAREGGARTLFLEVRPSNRRALRLYRGMGFCEVGVRRGYYPDEHRREDALVMAKEL